MPTSARLAREPSGAVADDLFAAAAKTPAVQSLQRRLESGGALCCSDVSQSAQPFISALLRRICPGRPIVVVTADLKAQESFQQDLETWLQVAAGRQEASAPLTPGSKTPSLASGRPLFYPAWETLPHEAKLPHSDVISERLETLVALARNGIADPRPVPLVVTSVTALLQLTFSPQELRRRTRGLARGDRLEPLDLVEWLEEQGYEPEAQVTQKGELALRGGILDVYPPTSPWPVRLEFFGDELESLRHFDPLTQVSREQIASVTLPPAGELAILKRDLDASILRAQSPEVTAGDDAESTGDRRPTLSPLLDYLSRETLFVFCEPGALAAHASQYAQQVPAGDPFFVPWQDFQAALSAKGMTRLEMSESEIPAWEEDRGCPNPEPPAAHHPPPADQGPPLAPLRLASLDAFRPLGDRAPEPQIAEAQRREFFAQLHRWLRQDHAVHVFCNNDGERQRFNEIWKEYGLGTLEQASSAPQAYRAVPHSNLVRHTYLSPRATAD